MVAAKMRIHFVREEVDCFFRGVVKADFEWVGNRGAVRRGLLMVFAVIMVFCVPCISSESV